MDTPEFWIGTGFAILHGFICHKVAENKKLPKYWAVLGFFFGIFAIVAIHLMPYEHERRSKRRKKRLGAGRSHSTSDETLCPFCNRVVRVGAVRCRACGGELQNPWASEPPR